MCSEVPQAYGFQLLLHAAGTGALCPVWLNKLPSMRSNKDCCWYWCQDAFCILSILTIFPTWFMVAYTPNILLNSHLCSKSTSSWPSIIISNRKATLHIPDHYRNHRHPRIILVLRLESTMAAGTVMPWLDIYLRINQRPWSRKNGVIITTSPHYSNTTFKNRILYRMFVVSLRFLQLSRQYAYNYNYSPRHTGHVCLFTLLNRVPQNFSS